MLQPSILATGAALLLGIFAGWSVRDWKADADALKALERGRKAEARAAAPVVKASHTYEYWRTADAPVRVETQHTIREIYRDKIVPADCAVDGAAVGVLNAARSRANAAASGEPRDELPKPTGSADAAARP